MIMKIIWQSGPMDRADILKNTNGRSWNLASIHLILNSMISKGFLMADDTKKYGRKYAALITREEYLMRCLRFCFPDLDENEILKECVQTLKRRKKKSQLV